MRTRKLEPSDRDPLVHIVRASFRPHEVNVALELIDAAVAGSVDYWILVAAEVANTPSGVAGYVCYGPTPMTASTYDLYWIATHPSARGRGVARALLEAMEADLGRRGATGIRVETEDTDEFGGARHLYHHMAYPVVARLPDFYSAGEGLLIYYKRL